MKFADILKSPEAEGKEKHVPVIEIGKGKGEGGADIVHVVVGKETPHPNTVEHYIAWIEVFGVKRTVRLSTWAGLPLGQPTPSPNIRFQVPVAEFKSFCALAHCNIHGLWENCLEI